MWRRLLMCSLALLLACCSLWAFPGRVTASQETAPTDTVAAAVQEEGPRLDSGTTSNGGSTVPSQSSRTAQEAMDKAADGSRLDADESQALYEELVAIREDAAALRDVSTAKDGHIDMLEAEAASLAADLEEARGEVGSKAYLMVEGIVGVDGLVPSYGMGLTLGARVGSSLMMQLGVDYTINTAMDFSLDRWTFRAGIGWMF